MKGACLLPSLDRAGLVKEFFESYKATKSTVPVWVLIDDKDPKREEYEELDLPPGCKLVLTGDAVGMGDKVRFVWDKIIDFDWVMLVNDDHRPRTEKWDQTILSAINGMNVIATNDGPEPAKPWNAPHRLCGALCFSGKVLRTLGYIFPNKLQHLYSDDVFAYLFGKANNAQVLMEVCVEHVHAYKNPELRDETYKKINGDADFSSPEPTGGLWEEDRKEFKKWLETQAEADVQKLIDIQPKQGIMIATPSHDGNCSLGYAYGLSDIAVFLQQHGVYFEMARVVGSSLIPHARNSLVDMFLKSRCQRLLFIDADQGYTKDSVLALLNSNKRIVAGITPHKRFPINLNFEPLPDDRKFFKSVTNKGLEEFIPYVKEKADPKGDIEVNRAGTGFIMIDRSVFEIMGEHVNQYCPFEERDDVTHKEFFWMGATKGEKKRYRGEDWFFCELAKELKIPIFINANAVVSHLGSYLFSIDGQARL